LIVRGQGVATDARQGVASAVVRATRQDAWVSVDPERIAIRLGFRHPAAGSRPLIALVMGEDRHLSVIRSWWRR
jgi:hypothetical protein